jgi:hypothetical protein
MVGFAVFVDHVGAAGGVGAAVGAVDGEGAIGCEVEGPAAFVDEVVMAGADGRLSHESRLSPRVWVWRG